MAATIEFSGGRPAVARQGSGSRTLLLGSGTFAAEMAAAMKARPQCGYELVGVVSVQATTASSCEGYPILGIAEDLHSIIMRTGAERIVVTLSNSSDLLPDHHLIEARISGNVLVEDGDEVYEELTGKLRIEALEPRVMIFNKDLKPSRFAMAAARIMSLVCALPALVLLLPVLAVIALAVKLDSAGPVLFVQERVGLGGKPFPLLKFRTMRPVERAVSEWAGDNSHRITRVGRVLRKYRLDELPQLLNVLRGDMNIVGPRPHPSSNFGLFVLVSRNTPESGFQIPYYSLRSMVRPGITGWAQVRYRYANNLREEIEKLRFDLYYVKHYSLLLDCKILFETIAVVLFGREFATTEADKAEAQAEVAEIAEIVASELADKRPRLTAVSGTATHFSPKRAAVPRSTV